MMESKPWYQSKTFWLNVATLISLALVLPEVGEVVPMWAGKYVAAFNAILNLGVRIFGTGGGALTLRKGDGQ